MKQMCVALLNFRYHGHMYATSHRDTHFTRAYLCLFKEPNTHTMHTQTIHTQYEQENAFLIKSSFPYLLLLMPLLFLPTNAQA